MATLGKTAPRLIDDLLDYDPSHSKNNGRNLLADDAPQYRGKAFLRKGMQDCRHVLMIKSEQSNVPASKDEQPNESKTYVVAAYCSKCRYHFDVAIDFRIRAGRQTPCRLSDPDNPMHHLRLVESRDAKEYAERGGYSKYDILAEYHRWECSGAICPAVVDIRITPPRLGKKMLSLITDKQKVHLRGRRVIQADPERFHGSTPSSPLQALSNLRTYLKDARGPKDPENPKKIAKRNRRLLLSFADECDSIFEYLDFKEIMEEASDPEVCSFLIYFVPILLLLF
jgi:ubiquitin carboxyl-terminal hydrolase 25/28